jgi:CRP-like cAMP-binding protein
MMPRSFLAGLEVFKGLPAPVLAKIEAGMTERRFRKGETLFLEGDPAKSVWFVKEGHVKAVTHSAEGKDLTLCMVGQGNLFGACCSLGGGRHPCHAVAETDVAVVSYPLEAFQELLEKWPELSRAVVEHLSQRLRQAKDTQAFDQESVEKRILHVLVDLGAQFGDTIPLTRREVAEMAGTTVETCIRTFSLLEKEGLVSGSRGRMSSRTPGSWRSG